jgi:DNA-binding beta-propeller fold protein YncE
VRQIPLFANDVVFDSNSARLYASVSSSGGATGNSIARINPVTGTVDGSVFVGSEPGKLALANVGNTLYVSLDGAGAVRRYDLSTQTAGAQFTVSDPSSEPFFVKDMSIAPGDPNLVAVSRKNVSGSPDFEGVAVYDNGVRRSLATPRHTGSDFIGFSSSASTLKALALGQGFKR